MHTISKPGGRRGEFGIIWTDRDNLPVWAWASAIPTSVQVIEALILGFLYHLSSLVRYDNAGGGRLVVVYSVAEELLYHLSEGSCQYIYTVKSKADCIVVSSHSLGSRY